MVRGTEKLTTLVLSTFILFTFAKEQTRKTSSINCSYVADSKEWSLVGVCTVTSPYEDTWCRWKEKNWPEKDATIGINTKSQSSDKGLFYWKCSGRFGLQLLNKVYTYQVLIPDQHQTWRKAFSVKVVEPGKQILKNCPEHVEEGRNIVCECSSEPEGSPRPVFSWPGHTDSSFLNLSDVRHNQTYKCEMKWGNQTKTLLYELTVTPGDNDLNASTSPPSLVAVIGVAGGAVLIIIIVTTLVVILVIRQKRKRVEERNTSADGQNNVYQKNLPNVEQTGEELIENRCYVDFQFDGDKDFEVAGDAYAEVEHISRHTGKTAQSELHAALGKNEGQQTLPTDVYAVVKKNKEKQPMKQEIYASVVKPSGKQQGKADNSRAEVYAVVDKGAKSESHVLSPPVDQIYAQVLKSTK